MIKIVSGYGEARLPPKGEFTPGILDLVDDAERNHRQTICINCDQFLPIQEWCRLLGRQRCKADCLRRYQQRKISICPAMPPKWGPSKT